MILAVWLCTYTVYLVTLNHYCFWSFNFFTFEILAPFFKKLQIYLHLKTTTGLFECDHTSPFPALLGLLRLRWDVHGGNIVECCSLMLESLSVSHTTVVFAQLGKVSKLNIALPQLLIARVMERIPMMFMTMPVFACGWNRFRSRECYIVASVIVSIIG